MERVVCLACAKEGLSRNEVGLNRKLLGRRIENFYCLECLAEQLGTTTGELRVRIEEFKARGCRMFDK